jgi:hypothetical protein
MVVTSIYQAWESPTKEDSTAGSNWCIISTGESILGWPKWQQFQKLSRYSENSAAGQQRNRLLLSSIPTVSAHSFNFATPNVGTPLLDLNLSRKGLAAKDLKQLGIEVELHWVLDNSRTKGTICPVVPQGVGRDLNQTALPWSLMSGHVLR